MVIENNLSADGTNKIRVLFQSHDPHSQLCSRKPLSFCNISTPSPKKNQLIGIYSNETKIINDDDDIIDIRHNDSK